MAAETRIIISARDMASGTIRRTSLAMQGLNRTMFTMRSAMAGVGMSMVVREIYAAGVQAEKVMGSFEVIMDSAKGAKKELAFLREEADRLGYNFWAIADSSKGLLAATKNTALAGEETRKLTSAVLSAGAAYRLSGAEIKGIMYAIQQIASKGKVSAEEIRRQLGDRLYGAFQIAARAMNITTQELDKMLKSGTLVADEFLPKFSRELQKVAGDATLGKAQRATEKWSEAITDLGVALAETGALENWASWIDLAAVSIQKVNRGIAIMFGLMDEGVANDRIPEITQNIISLNTQIAELEALERGGKYFTNIDAYRLTEARQELVKLRGELEAMLEVAGDGTVDLRIEFMRGKGAAMGRLTSMFPTQDGGEDSASDKTAIKSMEERTRQMQRMTAEIIRLREGEFAHQRVVLAQRTAELRKKYAGDKRMIAQVAAFEKASLDDISKAERKSLAERTQASLDAWAEKREAAQEAYVHALEMSNNMFDGIELANLEMQERLVSGSQMMAKVWTDMSQNMGQAFSTFFYDSVTGKLGDLGDYISNFINSIARSLTSVLGNQLAYSMVGGLGGLFDFGGGSSVETLGVQKPPKMLGFADGGVSYGPQLAMVSEGRFAAEAHVPLPNGRSIPVEIGSSGGGQQEVNVNFTVNAIDAASFQGALVQNKRLITGIVRDAIIQTGKRSSLG